MAALPGGSAVCPAGGGLGPGGGEALGLHSGQLTQTWCCPLPCTKQRCHIPLPEKSRLVHAESLEELKKTPGSTGSGKPVDLLLGRPLGSTM